MNQIDSLDVNSLDTAPIDFAVTQTTTMVHPTLQRNISNYQASQTNVLGFFHYSSNDNNFYHVTCRVILQGSVSLDDHDYDHAFFYQSSTENYYVTCKLFSHSLIVDLLNKKMYGINTGVNDLKQTVLLTLNQKLGLERDLKQILPFRFMQNHIPKREKGVGFENNIMTPRDIPMIGNQYHLNDDMIYQNSRIEEYTRSVINSIDSNNNPQRIEAGPDYNGNANSSYENTWNNVTTTTQADFTTYSNNGFLHRDGTERYHSQSAYDFPRQQILENFEVSSNYRNKNGLFHNGLQNGNEIEDSYTAHQQQQVDFNNYPRQHIPEKEIEPNCNRNMVSFNGNVSNGAMIERAALATNENSSYNDNEVQFNDVNRVGDYSQQQVDFNNRNVDLFNGNTDNNMMTTRSMLTTGVN